MCCSQLSWQHSPEAVLDSQPIWSGSRTWLMVGVPAVSGKLTQHGRRIGVVCFWVVLHCFADRFLHLPFSWMDFPLNLFLCGNKCRQLKRQLRQEKRKGELKLQGKVEVVCSREQTTPAPIAHLVGSFSEVNKSFL